jgi:hypothetical protein
MRCVNCGKEIPDGAAFCSGCGGKKGEGSPPPDKPAAGKRSLKPVLFTCAGAVLLVVLIAAFLNPSVSIKNIQTSSGITSGGRPVSAEEVFSADTPAVFAAMDVFNIREGSHMTASWYFEDEKMLLNTASIDLPPGYASPYFYYSPESGAWSEGSYRIDLGINGEILARKRFKIKGAPAAPAAASPRPDRKTFTSPDSGYTLSYPARWSEEVKEGVVVFRGPQGSEEYAAAVNVQMLPTEKSGGKYTNLKSVYDDFEAIIKPLGGRMLEAEDAAYERGGIKLPALRFVMTYEMHGKNYKEEAVVIQRNESYFHHISYSTHAELFEKYKNEAFSIIHSFTVIPYDEALKARDAEILENIRKAYREISEGIRVSLKRIDENTVHYDILAEEGIRDEPLEGLADMMKQVAGRFSAQYPSPQTVRISVYDESGRILHAEYSRITGETAGIFE